jgi:hypothetical protein
LAPWPILISETKFTKVSAPAWWKASKICNRGIFSHLDLDPHAFGAVCLLGAYVEDGNWRLHRGAIGYNQAKAAVRQGGIEGHEGALFGLCEPKFLPAAVVEGLEFDPGGVGPAGKRCRIVAVHQNNAVER